MIAPPGASGPDAQMVTPHYGIRAMVLVTMEVAQCSQRQN